MKVNLLFPNGKQKALTLSYDDGVNADKRFIELLKKHNIKCTFNINGGLFAPEGEEHSFRMTKSEAKKVYDNPLCEVATHGFTHPRLDTVDCMTEITKDKQELESIFGGVIRGHAYPHGSYNDNVVETLRQAGIVYARTVESHHSFKIPTDWLRMGATCHHDDARLFELADKFIDEDVGDNDGWLFYVWGHTFEFNRNENWDVIEKFFDKVSGNQNVWYATNIEIYDYVSAYRSLVCSDSSNTVYNPTDIDIWAKINGRAALVPAGKTVEI